MLTEVWVQFDVPKSEFCGLFTKTFPDTIPPGLLYCVGHFWELNEENRSFDTESGNLVVWLETAIDTAEDWPATQERMAKQGWKRDY